MTRTPSPDPRGGRCALCGREVEKITRHHLIPRSRHRRLRRKKRGRARDRRDLGRTVPLCAPCHRQVHIVFTEKELEEEYNTPEALAGHPQMRRFVEWISDKPQGTIPSRSRPR